MFISLEPTAIYQISLLQELLYTCVNSSSDSQMPIVTYYWAAIRPCPALIILEPLASKHQLRTDLTGGRDISIQGPKEQCTGTYSHIVIRAAIQFQNKVRKAAKTRMRESAVPFPIPCLLSYLRTRNATQLTNFREIFNLIKYELSETMKATTYPANLPLSFPSVPSTF